MKERFRWCNKYSSDCQLISAVNAYHKLTGKFITDKRYEKLIDIANCREEPPEDIKKIWDILGIEECNYLDAEALNDSSSLGYTLPMEASVFHHRYGYHSVLVIDYEPKSRALRITNFDEETTNTGWIFEENMYKFLRTSHEEDEPTWLYRTFRLKRKKNVRNRR